MKAYTLRSVRKIDGCRQTPNIIVGRHTARNDPRWPRITAHLIALRDRGRHAVRLVDADCGTGMLLIEATAFARSLGFTAVEGRGIDGSPVMIERARAAVGWLKDPGIGLKFELSDAITALGDEAEFPADIVFWHRAETDDHGRRMRDAVVAAGSIVIGDSTSNSSSTRMHD